MLRHAQWDCVMVKLKKEHTLVNMSVISLIMAEKTVDFKKIEFEVKNMGIMSWIMKGKKKTQIKFNPVANQPSQWRSTDLEYEGGCKNLHI